MKTKLHLVSMPWADPLNAPIQLGCLKAYIDQVFKGSLSVKTYAPYLGIPLQYKSGRFVDFVKEMEVYAEMPYLLIYANKFGFPDEKKSKIYTSHLADIKISHSPEEIYTLSPRLTSGLEKATCRYVDDQIAPHLIADGINIVGLTMNYNQVYSSVFCAKYLKNRFPSYKYVFLYGGTSITFPQTAAMFKAIHADGLGVIGEGEKKLEWAVKCCLEAQEKDFELLEDVIAQFAGIYKIKDGADLFERELKNFETQFKSIDELPLPDFHEYFDELRGYCETEESFLEAKKRTALVLEATRGCFAKCDFCGLNYTWDGFRKKTASVVADQAIAMVKEYANPNIVYADNVCDTWAEEYARVLIDKKLKYSAFMELRAHHPEGFWTMLALCGVEHIQIGVEAISPHLLGKMGKGTKVIQNLRTQKYLCELGIKSLSNLIASHPRSNIEDAKETARVIEHIPHFQAFIDSHFYLTIGAPLYNGLSLEEKRGLRMQGSVSFPASLSWLLKYAADFRLVSPDSLRLDDDLNAAWTRFLEWHSEFKKDEKNTAASLTVVRLDEDSLRVRDSRFGRYEEHCLEGAAARIYDACHGGITMEEISRLTRIAPESIMRHLVPLLGKKLLLETEGFYLSLALRPRNELINNFWSSERALRQAPPLPAALAQRT